MIELDDFVTVKHTGGLYYKHIEIVIDAVSVLSK